MRPYLEEVCDLVLAPFDCGVIGVAHDASQVFEDAYLVLKVPDALVDACERVDVEAGHAVVNACVECVDAGVECVECALEVLG